MGEIIKEICIYIINNTNSNVSLEDLENKFHYNKYYLVKAFKKYTGLTIMDFNNQVKVYKSIDPLLFTNDTILKIALNYGFNSQEYYSEKFKDTIGTSPQNFRNMYKEEQVRTERQEELGKLKAYKEYLLNINNSEEKLEKPKVYRKVA